MGGPQTKVSNKQISVYIADCVVDAYDLELKVPKVAPKTIIGQHHEDTKLPMHIPNILQSSGGTSNMEDILYTRPMRKPTREEFVSKQSWHVGEDEPRLCKSHDPTSDYRDRTYDGYPHALII